MEEKNDNELSPLPAAEEGSVSCYSAKAVESDPPGRHEQQLITFLCFVEHPASSLLSAFIASL